MAKNTKISKIKETEVTAGDITSVIGGTNISVSGGTSGDATVNLDSNISVNSISTDEIGSSTDINLNLDTDGNGTNAVKVKDHAGTVVCTIDESGNLTIAGNLSSTYASKSSGGNILVEDSGVVKSKTTAELKTDLTLNNVENKSSATIRGEIVSGDIPNNAADTSGNSATAKKLAATKTIAGVAFDGSANISLNNNAITNGAGYTTNTGDIERVRISTSSGNAEVTSGNADFTLSGTSPIGVTNSGTTITVAASDASASAKGVVELATTAEADTGTDTVRAVTPAGLKSHVDNRYAYQYLNWEVNTNSFTNTNYELPAANGGFGSDSFTINSGLARDTAIDGTVTMSINSNLQQQGWFVPHACKLVAVSGAFRNNGGESNPRDVAIFVGTPDIGTSNASTYTQRLFAAGDDDGGSSNSKIYKVNTVLATPFSLSAGDIVMPAVCNSTGSSTVSMQGNFNIIIATSIFTI